MAGCQGKPLPNGAECHDLATGEVVVAHRIVHTGDLAAPGLADDFRPNAARGMPRRGLERTYPVLHEGLSMYEQMEAASATARAFSRLGQFVARVELVAGREITFARWGARTHMTVWGEPEILTGLVTDVRPVRQ